MKQSEERVGNIPNCNQLKNMYKSCVNAKFIQKNCTNCNKKQKYVQNNYNP